MADESHKSQRSKLHKGLKGHDFCKNFKSWCSEVPFLVFWEDNFCLNCSLNQLSFSYFFMFVWLHIQVLDLFYILCTGLFKFSGYQFQLSILCWVFLHKNHENSLENIRTDVKIGIFPILIPYWLGFRIFTQSGENPKCLDCL